ncbi:carboxy terminal-processing peptidase [Catenovulum adriaticum]|uniref:Carboxy terminal-processing peptidase n=1 Tax=Catenovulum adriaticum TaxID=2984846 RepID=A0ABY7ALR7_9ALTE|nr:carboxy terminal-processing peptidase [Catenovulum sp. TS8]WAJ69289.1 carboxy terminal-processing peptidase [Catenovulum sp. TS8]
MFVKMPIRSLILSSAILFSNSLLAETANDKPITLPKLNQETQHALASKRIYQLFTREHYKRFQMDDAFSQKVFERYVDQLDYNKQFFLASDIEKMSANQNKFDEAFYRGDLSFVYDMYRVNLERRKKMYSYALSLLDEKKPMNFTGEDFYYYDREDATWAKSETELKEYWRERVKYDALNLKLTGKEWPDIVERLNKRYQTAIKRLSQSQSEDVFQAVMNAFARSIEAHTSYLSPRRADRFAMEMNLSLEGIGAVLFAEDDYTVIKSLVAGGPADKSQQIKPEDKIIGVAQGEEEMVDVIGWRLDDVVELIKGPKGTQVRLQVLKGDSADNKSIIVSIIRDKIKLEDRAATSKVYTPDSGVYKDRKVGVIEIPSFYSGITRDVVKELKALEEDKVEGIIIDLRGNGGGSLPESINLTGLFIEKGPVVQVRSVGNRVDIQKDRDARVFYSGPLVVMVDRYSASASEIFSAAIQDYDRGLVVGENTFGKGTVQQHRSLERRFDILDKPLGHIQYTFAKFYRINGGSTQNRGVRPDIQFPTAIDPAEWGESKEDNALPWDKIPSANYNSVGDITASQIAKLDKKHQARIKRDVEFSYIFDDIEEYNLNKDKKFESLNEKERVKERDEAKAERLKRANERLVRMGKEKVESVDDIPDDINEYDIFLNEAANILLDYVALTPTTGNDELAKQ